jgi:hypothetical protein
VLAQLGLPRTMGARVTDANISHDHPFLV